MHPIRCTPPVRFVNSKPETDEAAQWAAGGRDAGAGVEGEMAVIGVGAEEAAAAAGMGAATGGPSVGVKVTADECGDDSDGEAGAD